MPKTDRKPFRIFLALAAFSGFVLACAPMHGCNTVKGVGRDIEAVGQAGQDAIDDGTD